MSKKILLLLDTGVKLTVGKFIALTYLLLYLWKRVSPSHICQVRTVCCPKFIPQSNSLLPVAESLAQSYLPGEDSHIAIVGLSPNPIHRYL